MNAQVAQVILATGVCLMGIVSVYRLARIQRLSFRYAVGWMLLFGLGVFAGVLLPLTAEISDLVGLSPAALLAFVGIVIFLVISVQISISISGLQENSRLLAERLSQVQLRLDETSEH